MIYDCMRSSFVAETTQHKKETLEKCIQQNSRELKKNLSSNQPFLENSRIVFNISICILSETEQTSLRKSMNFANTSRIIPYEDTAPEVEA